MQALAATNPDATVTVSGTQGKMKYDVGLYNKENDAKFLGTNYISSPVLLSDAKNTATYSEASLTLGGEDKLGAFNGDNLVTSFSKYTLKGVDIGIVSGFFNDAKGTVSYNFRVTDTLTIKENAQVALGGQVATSLYAEYAGIIAKNVIVDGYNEGEEGYKGVTNLNSWSAYVNSLVVNGGSVKLHADTPQGNTCIVLKENSAASPADSKQVQITEALTITNGSVTIGHKSVADETNTDSHVVTTFGSYSYEGTPIVINGTVSGIKNPKINSSQITQEGGTLNIYGKSASIGGLNINQTGGKMSISEAINEFSGYHFISDYGQSTITQNGDSDTTLSIGVIKAYNTYFDSIVKSLKENEGANYDYTKPSVAITQGGSGIINLNGVDFTSGIGESKATSSITQTGNGTINLNGKYLGAKFDITQKGTTDGNKTGTIKVAKGAEITANSMTIESGVFINNGTVNGPKASKAATLAEDEDISSTTDEMATFITIAGGEYQNFGTTNADILVEKNGTLTLEAGSSVGNVEITGGKIDITGNSNTGALTLNGGTLTFSEGAVLNSSQITLSENVAIIVNVDASIMEALLNGEDSVKLFSVNVEQLEGATVTFAAEGHDDVKATVSQENGSVTITTVVPEPTTATLSLLALAALAARRRRR